MAAEQLFGDDALSIIDPEVRRHFPIFMALLFQRVQRTLLPEILDIFGQEAFLKFIDVFAGTTVTVPDRTVLTNLVRDADIYARLQEGESTEALADKYGITTEAVRWIHHQVKRVAAETLTP